jgi:hypothetical protein
MRWSTRALVAPIASGAIVTLLAGCDVLFPEFAGSNADASIADGGGVPDGGAVTGPHVAGVICAIADVRDFHSCAAGHGAGFRVTVEETRDATTADASGNFVLPLAHAVDTATVAAIDRTGASAPTIVTLALHGGAADGVALPVVATQTLDEIAATNAFAIDPARGTLLAWTIDANGQPVVGAAASTASAVGPLYEGATPNALAFGDATGAHGALALFSLTGPVASIAITAPRNGAVQSDQFNIQIRPGAITITTLILPSK